MADERKLKIEQNAQQMVRWLLDNRTEFEQQGTSEETVIRAVGLADADAREAIDHLENREEVVRIPKALTTPPQFVLKPGRGWREIKAEELRKHAGE